MTPRLPDGCRLLAFDEIGSTNDHAKMLAREGAAHGTVVWAKRQTAGRGRRSNTWTSIPGNLLMSVILRPECPARDAGQLSFLCAVALRDTARAALPPGVPVHLKWPNDLMVDGKKAAGILIEAETASGRTDWAVCGVGLNLAAAPEGAASLSAHGASCGAETALEAFTGSLMSLYADWRANGFSRARAAWLESAWRLNDDIGVRLPQETLNGRFLGIDETGALLLGLPGGKQRIIPSGEVFGL